jgi:hypothetical protein
MLPYFPAHLPDELLYGHIGRYRALNAAGPIRGFLLDVFGSATCIPSADLPTRLQDLMHRLEWIHPYDSLEKAVSLTTLYPYHRLFMPPERWARLLAAAGTSGPMNVKMFTGLVAQRFGASVCLRSCEQCSRDAWQRHGGAYWLRAHQLPGVVVCVHHGCKLDEHFVQSYATDRQELRPCPLPQDRSAIDATMSEEARQLDAHESAENARWRFAHLSRQALEFGATDVVSPDAAAVARTYRRRLAELGYGRGRNQVRWERLSTDLLARFDGFRDWPVGPRLSTLTRGSLGWVHGLVRRPERLSHPMCHLLLIDMLYGNLDAWLRAIDETSQTSRDRSAVPHVAVEAEAGTSAGDMEILLEDSTLSCRSIAALAGLATTTVVQMRRRLGIDVPRRSKHLSLSLIESVHARLAGGESMAAIMDGQNLSPSTLYRILSSDPKTRQERNQTLLAETNDFHRRAWLTARKLSPCASITEIRRQVPATYAWLYRHERAWLADNSPHAQKRSPPTARVNWPQRSALFARTSEGAAARMRSDAERKLRVSASALMRQIGPSTTIRRNLHRMPELQLALRAGSESIQAFQNLRVRRICSALSDIFGEPAPWRVMRIAGLRVLPPG